MSPQPRSQSRKRTNKGVQKPRAFNDNANRQTRRSEAVESDAEGDYIEADEFLQSASDSENEERRHQQDNVTSKTLLNADEERLQLAKQFLSSIEDDIQGEEESEEEGEDRVSKRLKIDSLKQQGKYTTQLASKYFVTAETPTSSQLTFVGESNQTTAHEVSVSKISRLLKGHRGSVTCVALTHDSPYRIFSASKDGSIVEHDMLSGKKMHTYRRGSVPGTSNARVGHRKPVLTIAISANDSYMATSGVDKFILVWDLSARRCVQKIQHLHRDVITSVCFAPDSSEMYSVSHDRTLKQYALSAAAATELDMRARDSEVAKSSDKFENTELYAYVDTLYGHQNHITSASCLTTRRIVTCGSDKTVRVFNTDAQTQLLYKYGVSSLDCLTMLSDAYFVTGAENGTLQLWHQNKKKPVQVVRHVGTDPIVTKHKSLRTLENNNLNITDPFDSHSSECSWVTAVKAVPYTDLCISGSANGNLCVWQFAERKLKLIQRLVDLPGFINAIEITGDTRYCLVATAPEHRWGRWWHYQNVQNGIRVIDLQKLTSGNGEALSNGFASPNRVSEQMNGYSVNRNSCDNGNGSDSGSNA